MTSDGGEELEFRVLGPVEVLRGGVPVPLPSGRRRALLGLLLVHAGEVVPTDRLLEELWRGEPPASAGHAIQVYVSNLRKLLEPGRARGATTEILRTQAGGYLLAVPPGGSDRARFESGVTQGRQALVEARAADAARLLAGALALWRGPAFADLADEPFAAAEAARLSELRLVATEGRIEAELALGRHAELAGELETLVGRHPFREHLWAQLIVALYRSGRQAEALRAYQRLRQGLADELGLEPSPALRDLEAAVLRHDPRLAAPAPAGAATAEPTSRLPAAVTPAAVEPASVFRPGAPPAAAAATHDTEPSAAAATDDTEPPIEEMRVVTALFVDLVGSTSLAEVLEPEEYTLIVRGAVDRMTAGAEALGGTVASRMGDGILALFGARTAHEDDPERAVRAALAIVDEIDAYGGEVARSWDVDPLVARAGVDTGPVVVASAAGEQVLGDVINTAARLQGASRPGHVLCSIAVQRLVDPLFEWGEQGRFDLKGKAELVEAFEALVPRAVPGPVRGLPGRHIALIGREAEMAAAGRSLDAVMAGSGGVLVVSGEPGTGKSRVLAELRQRFGGLVPGGLRSLWLEGRCLSWGESAAYWPFRVMLREWLGASPSYPALRTRVTLRRRIDELFEADGTDITTFLSGLLGLPLDGDSAGRVAALPPESLRHATFEALRALLRRLAEDGPVVVAVDDLHWADATSLQLIEYLLPATEAAAVLIVLALRPERGHGSWGVRETALRQLAHRGREVALEPLGAGAAALMLDELVEAGALPPSTAQALLDAAEGNPLFIEELVRSLLDAGALRPDAQGWRFDPGAPVEIPRTIETVLATRIDRLPAARRAVLGVAAVLGRQFELGLLVEVCDPGSDVEGAVEELSHLGLFEPARRWPNLEYRFRHVLAQEAAYRRLVADRRRHLHRRAAAALERLFPDPAAEQHGVLAFHHERAGEPEQALAHHRLAADAARFAYALDEAAAHYTAALDLAAAVPPPMARRESPTLHVWRGHVWYQLADPRAGDELRAALTGAREIADTATELRALEELALCEGLVEGRRPEGVARLKEALEVATRIGDGAAEVALRNRLTVELVNRLELDRALEAGEQALAAAHRSGDEILAARAMDGLKLVAFVLGDFRRLRALAGDLDDILGRHGDRWYLMFALAETSFAWAASGDWAEAFRRLGEARRLNEELGDRTNAACPLTLQAWLERARGHYGDAVSLARAAAAAAQEGRNTQWIAWSSVNLGAILAELGALDEAVERLEEGRSAAQRGIRIQLVRAQAHLASARTRAHHPEAETDLTAATELLGQVRTPPGTSFLYGLDAYLAVAGVHLSRGELAAHAALLAPLLPAAESAGWAEGVGRSTLALGECAALRGDGEGAATLLTRAVEAAVQAGIPAVEWQAHATLAGLYHHAGDRQEARMHRERSRAVVDLLAASITEPPLRRIFGAAADTKLERQLG